MVDLRKRFNKPIKNIFENCGAEYRKNCRQREKEKYEYEERMRKYDESFKKTCRQIEIMTKIIWAISIVTVLIVNAFTLYNIFK